jgi:hypothetical protein
LLNVHLHSYQVYIESENRTPILQISRINLGTTYNPK